MGSKKVVTLYKTGNILLVHPTSDSIFKLLENKLTFMEQTKQHGKGKSVIEFNRRVLFELDHKHRVVTFFGFWKLIRDTLRQNGYEVKFKDRTPADPNLFVPHWNNIKQYSLRENQPEFIQKLLTNRCGRFDCPPGFGKSFMIGLIAALLPKAQIDVVTRRVSVLRDRIYPELLQMVGDVGIVGGGKNVKDKRVMCYTSGSLRHSPATADILIGDECHELAADNSAKELVRWQSSRNYGLSASHDMRWDKKDFRTHGLFGPLIYRVNYQQAQDAKMVVPIKVSWSSVEMSYDPCQGYDDTVKRKRYGFWCNNKRNAVIAKDAQQYDDDTQVLITVETLEHAMNLKKQLPNFTLVYRENALTARDRNDYARNGFCSFDEPLMDSERRRNLTLAFEKGKLKKVICTTVWNVGVSFNALAVLIRADGGSSAINDVQIPGRVSRISTDKPYGVVHDYLDKFNKAFTARSIGRSKIYKANGWQQSFPDNFEPGEKV